MLLIILAYELIVLFQNNKCALLIYWNPKDDTSLRIFIEARTRTHPVFTGDHSS